MNELNVRAIIFTKNIRTAKNEFICMLFPWAETLVDSPATPVLGSQDTMCNVQF